MAKTTTVTEAAPPADDGIDWAGFRALLPEQTASVGRRGRMLRLISYVLWVLALVIVYLTWDGASGRAYVALQLPYFASGALVSALLCIIGSALFIGSFLADAVDQLGNRNE
jgi:hypothetical protein